MINTFLSGKVHALPAPLWLAGGWKAPEVKMNTTAQHVADATETKEKRWIPLITAMGDCRCCKHQDECAPMRVRELSDHSGHYRYRCPTLIKVDEDYPRGWAV